MRSEAAAPPSRQVHVKPLAGHAALRGARPKAPQRGAAEGVDNSSAVLDVLDAGVVVLVTVETSASVDAVAVYVVVVESVDTAVGVKDGAAA